MILWNEILLHDQPPLYNKKINLYVCDLASRWGSREHDQRENSMFNLGRVGFFKTHCESICQFSASKLDV